MYFIFLSVVFFLCLFFFFNDTATTEIYTLSLHDALPISPPGCSRLCAPVHAISSRCRRRDRKSTRLNSSHTVISYAVFCLKKKKKKKKSIIKLKKKKKNTKTKKKKKKT